MKAGPIPTEQPVRWGLYSHLRPDAIEAILASHPIAFVPWGALEWHCRHAPIGLDSIKAEGICVALAQRVGGVVLPTLPLGVNTIKPYKGFRHSIDISHELAARVAEEFCTQLADEGFRIIVLFTGHYPPEQFAALGEGVARARAAAPNARFEVWADLELLGDDFRPDHAGATETSFQMYFSPGSVHLEALPDRPLTLDGDGVMGDDPREASVERGAQQLAVVLARATAKMGEMMTELGIKA